MHGAGCRRGPAVPALHPVTSLPPLAPVPPVADDGGPRRRRSAMPTPVSPEAIAAALPELWSPRVIGEVDESYVKVARLHGVLAWHSHADEDELFYVLRGTLRIELEDGAVELGAGQMWVVPKGVRHNPVAEQECLVLLIERKSTLHTGEVVTDKTRSIAEQLAGAPVGPA